ncbi:MAG: endo-1,4-beta-xylanase [Gemmatimonadetes bacterium]|nr:endo-1,4-beta-xylanase [Gemmatimonadota bacterium]
MTGTGPAMSWPGRRSARSAASRWCATPIATPGISSTAGCSPHRCCRQVGAVPCWPGAFPRASERAPSPRIRGRDHEESGAVRPAPDARSRPGSVNAARPESPAWRPRPGFAPRGVALALVATATLAACGGDTPTGPKNKSCTEDPTQVKCQPPTDTFPSTLKGMAARTGRYFGASIYAGFRSANSAAYDAILAREFSMLVAGNDMKWDAVQPRRDAYNWFWGDSMVAFALRNGMKMRGHTLTWHNQVPAYIRSQNWSADTARVVLTEHINGVVTHFQGRIYAWDVVNEPIDDSGLLRDTLFARSLGGTAFFETVFRSARAADPAALLFWNDYNLETPGPKQDSTVAWITRLKAAGVPIDGIGLQAHLAITAGGSGAAAQQVYFATLQRFASLGLKIHLTELDVRLPVEGGGTVELQAQNQAWANIIGACRLVSACEAIVVWGVNDGESWLTPGNVRKPLLFTDDLSKKDVYYTVLNALR